MSQRLIIFTRYPEAGTTKKRLVPALGAEGAARLQCEMTAHTLQWARAWSSQHGGDLEVHFAGGRRGLMQTRFGTDLTYRPQAEGDLGQRMAVAFRTALQSGGLRVVLVGSDCPQLTVELARTAFRRLADHDVVLGPAIDGGYYLVGLRREAPELFAEMPWGTSNVLQQTLRTAARLGLSVAQLPRLADVDRPEDLPIWDHIRESVLAERISIIIPTLNEAEYLAAALRSTQNASNVETLVTDAGSSDQTGAIARSHGVALFHVPGGRARQINTAAAAASGGILLLLHADTRLPDGFDGHVRRILGQPGVVGGAFRLRIKGARGSLRLIAGVANLRAEFLQMPYGDQAIFLRREKFERLGGLAELPIMEDYDLLRRLRRVGRIRIAPAGVVTSARRWKALGPWRTTWINQMIVLGHHLGVSPGRLAGWYRRGEDSPDYS